MTHWYDRNGNLILEVPKANGKGYKATTMKEARAMGLSPSVTTVLSVLDKPMLTDWKVEQAIMSAWAWNAPDGTRREPDPDEVKAIKQSSEDYTKWASDFGTAIHAQVADRLQGKPVWATSPLDVQAVPLAAAACYWMEREGFVCEASEKSFCSSLGFAGTIDFLGYYKGEPIVMDFKTRDNLSTKNPSYYDEQALQLSGYAVGIGQQYRRRFSMLIDRAEPGVVKTHEWPDAAKWDRKWMALWNFWCEMKDWGAGRVNMEEWAHG